MKRIRTTNLFRGVLFALALTGCSEQNSLYCDEETPCGDGQRCEDNACKTTEAVRPIDAGTPQLDAPILAECPSQTHQCVAKSPAGWSGPAIQSEALSGGPEACPEGFEAGELLGGHGAIDQDASCSCSCGVTTSLSCSPGNIEGRNGPYDQFTCFQECTSDFCVQQFLSEGVCTFIAPSVESQNVWTRFPGRVLGGSCEPAVVSENFAEPTFEAQTQLCEADIVEGDCGASEVCTANPVEHFLPNMCIYREGEHECPEDSEYSNRVLTYEGTQDARECGSCNCSTPVGASCGKVDLYSDDDICETPMTGLNMCEPNLGLLSGRAKFVKSESKPCEPSNENPEVLGAASGTGATTICCAF